MLQTVVELDAYISSARAEGMSDAERARVVDIVAADPSAGVVIRGSGGCRKVRIAGKGKGKSGGYRIVTVFGGGDIPVFLIAVLAKSSRANFSASETASMAVLAKRLIQGARLRAGP